METNLGDILVCEEQLRTTLHCDDKEKLRQKLAQLKREYFRTVQRLKRAERLDAVRKHVGSRLTRQNQQDQSDAEGTSNLCLNSSSLMPDSNSSSSSSDVTALEIPQCQTRAEDDHIDNSKGNEASRFPLPSDAACPETSGPGHGKHRGHKPSPAMRLRSRRSRLRWERRSAEISRSTDNSEKDQDPSDRIECPGTAGEEEKDKSEISDVVNESEELFSGVDSESPSLLLTHWNTYRCTETEDTDRKESQGKQEQREKETALRKEVKKDSLSLLTCSTFITTEEKGEDGTHNERCNELEGEEDGDGGGGQREGSECRESNGKDTELNLTDLQREGNLDSVEAKEEKDGITGEGKGVSLRESCTLVEGLLFPAEYYVRTTRRMTFSQSQPDMQAVVVSQLCTGRHRRSRCQGRGLIRSTNSLPDQRNQTALPSLTATSADPTKPSQVQTEASQSSGEISAGRINLGTCSSPAIPTPHPTRGRRRRRGRGRGRALTSRPSQSVGTLHSASENPSTPASSSPSVHEAGGPEPPQNASKGFLERDEPAQNPASHGCHGNSGAPSSSVSGNLEKVYSSFLENNMKMNRSPQMNGSTCSWRSLLLPSSSPAHASLLPLPSLSLGRLLNLEIQQDFHLPDDQFASLKLQKLRRVTVESGVEPFSSPSHNTRGSLQCFDAQFTSSSLAMPLSLPFSSTPPITNTPHRSGDPQAASQTMDHQDLSVEHKRIDKLMSDSLTEHQQTVNTHVVTHTDLTESVSVVPECADECLDKGKRHENCTGKQAPRKSPDRPPLLKTFDCSPQETPEEPSNSCTVLQTCNDTENPVNHQNVQHQPHESTEPFELNSSISTETENKTKHLRDTDAQLLLTPLASAPNPFNTPHPPLSTLTSSPVLPSLGLTPHPVNNSIHLSPSPAAPALNLLLPHSPSTQNLSPRQSITYLPPTVPPLSPSGQIEASLELTSDRCHRAEPATSLDIELQGSGGQVGLKTKEAEEYTVTHTHTLKAAAGGSLVDACCFFGPSGGFYVAAAGKWAVCLWSQTSESDWTLVHTWNFNDPVISMFSVPIATGLICVTLGQLEIREVRMLSCSSLVQTLLCERVVQAVVGLSKSRVVTSSHSATGSTLQVLTLSDNSSSASSQPLVSPGVFIGTLAPVDGLCDALVGTDEGGHLFVWNLKTGQLLCTLDLGDDLSHTACLQGYSCCGVLFVLLQHHLLSSLEEEKEVKVKDGVFSEERVKTNAMFSLVAVNPLTGKSVLATQLYPPKAWSGRLCEADVSRCSVVGRSQNGCVCIWELGCRGTQRMVGAPESSEGWQLARWGEGDMLVTGHHNGDVTLHRYSGSQTSVCH
ncbi:uncharacterized protein palb2 [Pholidichthys leucotaenia]